MTCLFDRFSGGIEFFGAPQRWVINANWKLPMENQLGDVNHGAFLHSAIIPREAQDVIEKLGYSVVTTPGHGATFRLMPEGGPVDDVAWGMEAVGSIFGGAEVQNYLREIQAGAAARVGDVRARMKGLTYHDVAERLDVAESTVKRWFVLDFKQKVFYYKPEMQAIQFKTVAKF